jgi:hypothetical protein
MDNFALLVLVGVVVGFVVKKWNSITLSLKSGFPRDKRRAWSYLRDQLVALGNALWFYGVLYLIFYFGYLLLSTLINSEIEPKLAVQMLTAVIGLDGVLIGFVGVIGVYVLSEVSRTVEKSGVGYYYNMEMYESWRTNNMYLLALAVLAFAASVLFSLQSMSYIVPTKTVPNLSLLLVIDPMLLGIVGILWIIRSSKPPSRQ